jgi:uncharacterized membrane protein
MNMQNKKGASFVEIVGFIGVILIFLGVIWLIATNWHQIPDFFKISILVLSTLASLALGVFARVKDYEKIGSALIVLGALLYVASIFLIAQIFSTETSIQGIAWLFFLCWVGVILIAYALKSSENIFVGLVTFLAWFTAQFIALAEASNDVSVGLLAFGFLGIGLLLYGLNLLHASFKHAFAEVYKFWSAFYFLALFYLLSFQVLIPVFWEEALQFTSYFYFVILLIIVAIIVLLTGIVTAINKEVVELKELLTLVGAVLVMSLFLVLSGLFDGGVSIFGNGGTASWGLWSFWAIINICFIAFILLMVGYGKWIKSEPIVNLAIGFFVLDVVTRYIGFIADVGNLAVVFIIGGLLLVFLGWVVSKWRKDLVEDIPEEKVPQNTQK